MGQALYRKHRPKKLAEVVGQEHITTTLENALKKGAISHAYLFTGPRGVGKTSIARIMAHEVNGLPYDEEASHLDIIEIDAASNRRIDEIRTLRERVHNTPASAKYKIYIIDEVHMLTKEAFNALLKTLEEPPEHAIFILATTEAHKLPETIVSRTQRFSFKPVDRDKAVSHLRHIADQEKIDTKDDALQLIAEHGGGSFRDSISLLDQLGSSGAVVDLAAAQKSLGIAPDTAIENIVGQLAAGNASRLLETLVELRDQGYQAPQIAKQLAKRLRANLINGQSPLDPAHSAKVMQELIDVPASHDPEALLEILLLDAVLANTQAQPAETPLPTLEANTPEEVPEPEPVIPPEAEDPTPSSADNADADWRQVLKTLKQKHNTVYALARMAEPKWDKGALTLKFNFPFHKKRMEDTKNKQLLADIVAKQMDKEIEINCIVSEKPKPKPQKSEKKPNPNLKTISNIFGGGELL